MNEGTTGEHPEQLSSQGHQPGGPGKPDQHSAASDPRVSPPIASQPNAPRPPQPKGGILKRFSEFAKERITPERTPADLPLFHLELREKLRKAKALRDFAFFEKNLSIPETVEVTAEQIHEQINKAQIYESGLIGTAQTDNPFGNKTEDKVVELLTGLDRVIESLTKITFPDTADVIDPPDVPVRIRRFLLTVAIVGLVACTGLVHVFSYTSQWDLGSLVAVYGGISLTFAALLGTLGALLFIMLNILGIRTADRIKLERGYIVYFRLVQGAYVGWIIYWFVVISNIEQIGVEYGFMMAFLAGFSTTLVMGILNKTIEGLSRAFGLSASGKV